MSDAVSVMRQVWLDATGAAYGGTEYREAVGAEFAAPNPYRKGMGDE